MSVSPQVKLTPTSTALLDRLTHLQMLPSCQLLGLTGNSWRGPNRRRWPEAEMAL